MIIIPLMIILIFAAIALLGLKKYFEDAAAGTPAAIDALVSSEELKRHAEEIALLHKIYAGKRKYTFLFSRLKDDYKYILKTYQNLNEHIKTGASLCPASEWLLDNFYIIEEHYKDILKNTRGNFLKELPILSEGNYRGYPRVFAVALELISHTDGRIDKDQLIGFVNAYQSCSNLSMAELWALCPMIKIALIEKIRSLCEKINATQAQWNEAEKAAETSISQAFEIIENNLKSKETISYSFIEHFFRISKGKENSFDLLLNAIHEKLLDHNTDLDKAVASEHHNQAAMQISIGNCISSLRLVISLDWPEIFEMLSSVEKTLRNDPSGIYSMQDYDSRNYYRHKIENYAKILNVSETAVARKAVYCAEMFGRNPDRYPSNHIGYYIAGKGRNLLMSEIDPRYAGRPHRIPSLCVYILPIIILTLLISVFPAIYCHASSENMSLSIFCFLIFLLPAGEVATIIVNSAITHIKEPSFLPKIEYGEFIPQSNSTVVVVPSILPDSERAEQLIRNLEVTYLANKCKNIYFALLGDFKDAPYEFCPEDEKIIAAVSSEIKALNEKYSADHNHDLFYFFIRKRIYSESQERWMGWERKRGAIIEFNRILRNGRSHTFSHKSENIDPLNNVRYVITLDADTILPIGAAKKLIGTISHPLNSAVIDEKKNIVKEGYGIIQPRIGINVECSNKSLFSRIFAGYGGVDPYTNAISDVYQDLFGEGIFTGKGIYELDVFNRCLENTIPDHLVLSHDLLESSYIRAGLATDIELIDGCPEKYNSYILRLHRWVRGDWQIIKWLFPYIKDRNNNKIKNPINRLSKWKIFDNLRRSMVPSGYTLLFFSALLFLPGNALIWLLSAVLLMFFPVIAAVFDFEFLPKQRSNRNLIYGLKALFYQRLIQFVLLPHICYMMINAVAKTLYRLFISKKNLLEWITASDAEKNLKNTPGSFFIMMLPSLYKVVFLPAAVYFLMPQNLGYSLILTVLWLSSPFCAYFISKKDSISSIKFSAAESDYIRKICRKTWSYYEDFASEKDNYLPADNYQIKPVERIAHRTSPTNIGFLLISILSARDLGYISTSALYKMVDNTLTSIEKLEKWNGHLYNWYDTQTLEVMHPAYVSTVDSGNLVSYCIALKQGLKSCLSEALIRVSDIRGLKDTFDIYNSKNNGYTEVFNKLADHKFFTLKDLYAAIELLNKNFLQSGKTNQKIAAALNQITNELEAFYPAFLLKDSFSDLSAIEFCQNIFDLLSQISPAASVTELDRIYGEALGEIEKITDSCKHLKTDEELLISVKNDISASKNNTEKIISLASAIEKRLDSLIAGTDFTPLFDKNVGLFSIGYNAEEEELTNSHYDLLASEARIASYIAACRGNVPISHWFNLGRTLTIINGYRSLVSWTGTMFEYLMPPIVMANFKNTLLDETYHTVVNAQIVYGRKRNLPWGTSESAYNAFDFSLNYQYKAFGVPGLGLKRGLINDMVVSPYSTILALPFAPAEAMNNLKKLASFGAEGKYGLYEAIDFTPGRMILGSEFAVVSCFMAHHQGMIINVLNNCLNDDIMVKRFHSDPLIKAGEYLLQEKIPVHVIITNELKEAVGPFEKKPQTDISYVRKAGIPSSSLPVCHMLSNGSFSTLLTDRGTGYIKVSDIHVSRWREDAVSNKSGIFFFIKNTASGKVWSSAFGPLNQIPDKYEVKFSVDKGEYIRTDGEIETHTQICVSPEDNCEVRTITLSNHGNEPAVLECTSYFEIVLSNIMADIAHPAFNNLFIKTEILKEYGSLLALRRPRDEKSTPLWAFHTLTVEGECTSDLEYETDRCKFIGRGRNIWNANALDHPLSNSTGPVLDPVMSIRKRVRIAPGSHARLCYTTGTAENRNAAVELIRKYSELQNIARVFELAYIRSQIALKYLDLTAKDIRMFDEIISHVVHLSPLRKNYTKIIQNNRLGQSGLWPYGISGDLPVVLVTIDDIDDLNVIRKLVKAHEYFRMKGLKIDLIILNEDKSDYLQPLQNALTDIIQASHARDSSGRHGGIYAVNSRLISEDTKTLFFSVSRLVLNAKNPRIDQQTAVDETVPLNNMQIVQPSCHKENCQDAPQDLAFFNSYGGFDQDSWEYVIHLKEGCHTPAPWSNVIANEQFGCIVTENGAGYTWAENSRENKLTHWSNDPVSDSPSEIIYIRDDASGYAWSITPLPIRESAGYTVRHGRGYSVFTHLSSGINQELTVFVAEKDPVKIYLVKLKNESDVKRELSLFYYVLPVLGVSDQLSNPYIVAEAGKNRKAILIKNTYNQDFSERIAFAASSEEIKSCTSDRMEFLGLHGNIGAPAGIRKEILSGKLGVSCNTCCVIHISVELEPFEEKKISFMLGQSKNEELIRFIADKYSQIKNCEIELDNIKAFWQKITGAIQIKTPDITMDIMLNSYLLYQAISCRLWARSAFYQSGGAYGFRDQLQDVLCILYAMPETAKAQILKHCSHQFEEGDVLHWWHPGDCEKGIRTKFSDDLLWLPFVVSEYAEKTGDYSILNETIHYIRGDLLNEDEDERYIIPEISSKKSSVYEHCIRAIERSLKFGSHGIPLMGCGDWNDGMSTVGNKGKGESVWMAWFLYAVIQKFIPLCKYKNDLKREKKYKKISESIRKSAEENAWDGEWYRRAYYDDGSPMGSSINDECRIDSISQSWAVISGAGDKERSFKAMTAVENYLIKRDEGFIMLFTPPFENGNQNPGYIKGYVPGVRENGGQYTHAAVWVISAFAKMGMGDKAHELFHMINPINHTQNHMQCAKYKTEPYIMAADVYSVEPHAGRGGWTWYTGTASWMYKVGLEEILGFKKNGSILRIMPCIPADWSSYSITYNYENTAYCITVSNPNRKNTGITQISIDGHIIADNAIPLLKDGGRHYVEIVM